MKKPILILKIGTASITQADGSLDEPVLVEVVRQVQKLHGEYRLVLVSSGAVGTGKRYLPGFSGQMTERKAAAAIGNPILLNKYAQFLAPYGITIAQSLCERRHFSNRHQFLQLRATFEALWQHGIIPIANENDVVSEVELRFSDNDELATLMAVGFGAQALLLGTSVPGLLDANGQLVSRIEHVDAETLGLARQERSGLGLGGMISKLTFARLATRLGIQVVIFGIREANSILLAARARTGTLCLAQTSSLSARRKWLASGSLVMGRLRVDEGAFRALGERNSLLAVGVAAVEGEFDAGEVIELVRNTDETPFAVARSKHSAQFIAQHLGQQRLEIAHANEIVLLQAS